MINVDFNELWPKIIEALERIIPLYEEVGEYISLWQARRGRWYAIQEADLDSQMTILDAGIGPGTMSKMIFSRSRPWFVVGLDVSKKMLRTAVRDLLPFGWKINAVRGILERMPFRSGVFDRVFSSFALEDSPDRYSMMQEIHRVCVDDGLAVIVNLGKPDNRVVRHLMNLYIKRLMPLIAQASTTIRKAQISWLMLIPVYQNLPTNRLLIAELETLFETVSFRSLMLGGVIVVTARKAKNASNVFSES